MTLSRRAATRLLAGLTVAPLIGETGAFAASTVRFSLQRSSTLLTILKTEGSLDRRLAAAGFEATWHLFDNVIDPMNAGAVDFNADVADAVPIFTQSAGARLTFYAKEEPSPAAEAIIVKADSPIRTVHDLKGKTVAVHRGSGCHFVLAAALKRDGLSFADIKPAYLKPTDASAAFERGSVEAWVVWDPFLAITEAKRPTRTLCDASGLSSYNRYYTVGTAFADAHPDVVGLVYESLADAGRWVKQHPEEAAVKLSPIWGGISPEVITKVNARRSYAIAPVEKQGLREQQLIADTFLDAKLIPKRIDATDVRIWHPPGKRT